MKNEQKRYLLGKGQELFEREKWKPRNIPPPQVYTLEEAQNKLVPRIESARKLAGEQDEKYCLDGSRTLSMIVHPAFISKSAMPTKTFQSFGLDVLGSTGVSLKPRKSSRKTEGPTEELGMKLYVAGTLRAWRTYEKFATELVDDENVDADYKDLRSEFKSFEDISLFAPEDKIGEIAVKKGRGNVEVILQKGRADDRVLTGFEAFLTEIGVEFDSAYVIDTSGLVFVPLHVSAFQLEEIGRFSHVRFIRSAARLRTFRPRSRSSLIPTSRFPKPTALVESEDFRVAIFDGGLGHDEFSDWVDYEDLTTGDPGDDLLEHGSNVTSAFLFGHTGRRPSSLGVPPCRVDHYKVLSADDDNPYLVLNRILSTLRSRDYKFVNLSVGPDYAVNDHHLDPWTVALDEIARAQDMFIAIAAGNDGDGDQIVGNHRIQPPSDGVNVVGVGALDRYGDETACRAFYSSFGPGRSPGLVKPDISVFGGSEDEMFGFVGSFKTCAIATDLGTSFASPLVLRAAAGIRARIQNEDLTPLAVRALLLHHAERFDHHSMDEVGWGILALPDPEGMITCQDGEVKIIYQGRRLGKKIVRTPIPLPNLASLVKEGVLPSTAKAELKVTICLSSDLNPADSANYTRNGVVVTHRNKDSDPEATRTLFSKKSVYQFATEATLRGDAHKWATALVGTDSLQIKSWDNPVLDFHFLERDRLGDSAGNSTIPYAIVISVRIPKILNLYDLVLERYRSKLAPVRPRLAERIRI